MGKLVKLYDVWTDGSYDNARHVGGAGWLIRRGEDEREGWRVLKDFPKDAKPHGSDAAEMFAVGSALRDIPAGAVVRLRLDCQNVLDWFNAGKITTKSKSDVRFLRQIFGRAMQEVRAMEKIEFIKVGGKSNADLERAHALSRKARHFARHGRLDPRRG